FSLASIVSLHSHMKVGQEFSNDECQAAACALLKHNAHLDGTHFHTRKPAGLHPSYIAFNSYTTLDEKSSTHEDFVEAALQDLFDTVAMQDHLDGGISLLICCPGSEATPALLPEHLSLDLYITLRELHETPERIGGDISVLVQAFAEENHKKLVSDVRGAICREINRTLHKFVITQDPSARMHWANYWRSVVQRYLVVIEGWPDNIPFVNLSNVSSTLPDL
ncbi:uncharacterized protein EDB91DRAFT_1011812, partial [Suillus paluster]|uniref:uncharacterized protein n=1 Tax=Suillus paluster TaxID=48578 RepID=UPI001B86B9DE